ncbi:hypothetical protein CBR_g30566 [Chara braunii]|uniref:Uncharacterized protein n=1 Tax=Chara braunii TaxID=69332 RepID=A0A388LD31_CHABU|nr:hypothetical protein CBR_g30566 [Chara braunii]|eukprot:GBG80200.1 hypothetical protein CBR_g30566 [Chara braunii]
MVDTTEVIEKDSAARHPVALPATSVVIMPINEDMAGAHQAAVCRLLMTPTEEGPIEELNKSLASVLEFVLSEKAKKAEEERLKQEAEAEEERKVVEKKVREEKERKRLAKLQKQWERDAEMDKKLEIQFALKTGDFFDRMEANLGPVLELVRTKAKKRVEDASIPSPEPEDSDSTIEEIRTHTGRLTISEKRKRGPEPVLEDSPPMVTPAKRTPGRNKAMTGATPGRMTWSKAKVKTRLSPLVAKHKRSPEKPRTVAKLRFRNQAMEELHCLDAQELQSICKTEGIAYNGKIDAIFDIASHRTRVAFREVEPVDISENAEPVEEESTTADDEGHEDKE